MSDSPIFDRLVSEFAAKGAAYEEFIKWSAPAFVWTPQHVVQLDKQPKTGVRLDKLLEVPKVSGINPNPELLEQYDVSAEVTETFGDMFQRFVVDPLHDFVKDHPGAVITKTDVKKNDDGTMSLVVEGLQPITPIKPLSERNTAELME